MERRPTVAGTAGRATPNAKHFKSLIEVDKASHEFARLGDRTKEEYLRHMARIEVKFGSLPISGLADRRVRGVFLEWRDGVAKTSLRNAASAFSF